MCLQTLSSLVHALLKTNMQDFTFKTYFFVEVTLFFYI